MTFREIDGKMLSLIDENGEIMDEEAFRALQMERDKKAENMALWVLDLRDEQAALKGEIKRLQERLDQAVRREKRLREYLGAVLDGEVLKTPKVSVFYRSSQAVAVNDAEKVIAWAEKDERYRDMVLTYKAPEISKAEVKKLIADGVDVPGAEIVTSVSTQVR